MYKMTVATERCKGCALCVSACPLHILEMDKSTTNKKGYHVMRNTAEEKCDRHKSAKRLLKPRINRIQEPLYDGILLITSLHLRQTEKVEKCLE